MTPLRKDLAPMNMMSESLTIVLYDPQASWDSFCSRYSRSAVLYVVSEQIGHTLSLLKINAVDSEDISIVDEFIYGDILIPKIRC